MQFQRCRSVATLRGCLAGSRTRRAGDPDNVALTRLQDILSLLRYLPASGVDGIFSERTGRSVRRLDQDNDLAPTDPVAGRGTMAALDAVFAGQPDDGDQPVSSRKGLQDLTEEPRGRVEAWVRVADTALATWPDPLQPGKAVSGLRAGRKRTLLRNLRIHLVPVTVARS